MNNHNYSSIAILIFIARHYNVKDNSVSLFFIPALALALLTFLLKKTRSPGCWFVFSQPLHDRSPHASLLHLVLGYHLLHSCLHPLLQLLRRLPRQHIDLVPDMGGQSDRQPPHHRRCNLVGHLPAHLPQSGPSGDGVESLPNILSKNRNNRSSCTVRLIWRSISCPALPVFTAILANPVLFQ